MEKFISLSLALLVTICLMLTGVAIGEGSAIGVILSLVAAFSLVGFGIKIKKTR